MRLLFFVFFFASSFLAVSQSLIPKPQKAVYSNGSFKLDKSTSLLVEEGAGIIRDLGLPWRLTEKKASSANQISFAVDKKLGAEAYTVSVDAKGVQVKAAEPAGFFYAYQTLLQLASNSKTGEVNFPYVKIEDKPSFVYRGVMIDVARHFYKPAFIKKMIDVFASYKINRLHWHLTDDQGWRIEIKKYPKLTTVGSVRKETMTGHYSENRFDGKPYGGFYTQDEIRDVVAYAQSKFITIVPEIEMPGHSMAALTAYPELGCTGGPYELRTKWGVEDHIYCPTDKTFEFLEDVLTEVMDLFPGEYIHIGGDEAPKITWKNSEFCQELMKKEGLKNEEELQSYFIKRIDKFVTSKGRKIIGWDEILEGGLSPNAAVMSWRSEEGGIEAAKEKHNVVMTPNSHMYLDFYQGEQAFEPLAIGHYLPLEKVYSYEPLSDKLTKEDQKYIMGVQANMWTEYITTESHAEYMLFPRVLAAAEIAWTNGEKNYADFVNRVESHMQTLAQKGINVSNSFRNVKFKIDKDSFGRVLASMSSTAVTGDIRYTTDGSTVNSQSLLFSKPVLIDKDLTIRAGVFSKEGNLLSKVTSRSFEFSKSTGMDYTFTQEPDRNGLGGGNVLSDGLKGDANSFDLWVGFFGKDLEMVYDFGKTISVSGLSLGFQGDYTSWVQTPRAVEVLVSTDGVDYNLVKKEELGEMVDLSKHIRNLNLTFGKTNARYVKIRAINQGLLPKGHPSEGNKSWIFVDEISVK